MKSWAWKFGDRAERCADAPSIRGVGGWFGEANTAPDVPRDSTVLTEEDEHRYVASLKRNGFSGPDRWYMNSEVNADFARRATSNWRLTMPVLFLHVRLRVRND